MNQLKKQISQMEETTSKPFKNLLTFTGFHQLKKLLRGLLFLFLIFIVGFLATTLSETSSASSINTNNIKFVKIEKVSDSLCINNIRVLSTEKLIKEVDTYIKSVAPNTKLNAKLLVKLCNEYNIDITFVLAQGMLESGLGTKGRALITNSVWNVGSFDNGRTYFSYRDPNESIEPYLKLLRGDYLIKISSKGDTINKDIKHLIQDRGFINISGHRYATAYNYENSLRTMMVKVNMESSIQLYQGILNLPNKEILDFFSVSVPKDSLYFTKL